MSSRRASGGLESEVLATLWAAGRPLTAGDVVEALGGDLAYNTVLTILTAYPAMAWLVVGPTFGKMLLV